MLKLLPNWTYLTREQSNKHGGNMVTNVTWIQCWILFGYQSWRIFKHSQAVPGLNIHMSSSTCFLRKSDSEEVGEL